MKQRLDLLLVEKGLAESRNKAQAMILAGQVTLTPPPPIKSGDNAFFSFQGRRIKGEGLKPGTSVPENSEIEIKQLPRFVSRSGEKLQAALTHWKIPVQDKICLDIGSSTGGFTDCLLQNGAKKVYAVDVGYGQMHPKLRNDLRVELYEQTHILQWQPPWLKCSHESWAMGHESKSNNSQLTTQNLRPTLVTIDLSFISLRKVLPKVLNLLQPFPELQSEIQNQKSKILALFKPQFEVGARYLRKGIVRDAKIRQEAVKNFLGDLPALPVPSIAEGSKTNLSFLKIIDHFPCPVLGAKGNQEEWLFLELRSL